MYRFFFYVKPWCGSDDHQQILLNLEVHIPTDFLETHLSMYCSPVRSSTYLGVGLVKALPAGATTSNQSASPDRNRLFSVKRHKICLGVLGSFFPKSSIQKSIDQQICGFNPIGRRILSVGWTPRSAAATFVEHPTCNQAAGSVLFQYKLEYQQEEDTPLATA